MNICRITAYFYPKPGGKEFHCYNLTKIQAEKGNNVDLFTMYGGLDIHPNVNTHKIRLRFIRKSWQNNLVVILFFMIAASWKVIQSHKNRKYDVIHLHGDFVEAFLGGILGRILRIPSVITIHGGLSDKWVSGYPILLKFCYNSLTRIITVSSNIKNQLTTIGINPEKIDVISSGIYLNNLTIVDASRKEKIYQNVK